ncbi:protein serine threonine kinase [Stylonychia lemnae]|uniref:non-specific serine/threonine protein kinase n=1 Tax=Stylonychia lemnae TaxID=5949 RepID=A0A078BAE6_STYLE|nr:protein serine threonine kinase [Stylonychia lemnae]|eukprot:CDW90232.1 protein serine threonine kinase [Stylonychia lemnae]
MSNLSKNPIQDVTSTQEAFFQPSSIPTLFNTPKFCFTARDIVPLNLDDLINENKLSILSLLSASQNEGSEKDRTISNDTVGLNSTTDLSPRQAQNSFNKSQEEKTFSPFKLIDFKEKLMPLSTQKPTPNQGIFTQDDKQLSQNPIRRNLFNQQQPLTPTSSSNDRTLRDIKNFNFIGKVGEGAYGVVWSALHTPSQRLYAIKVIQKSRVEKLDKVHEIQNEKNLLSKISHPNIVKLHSTFTDQKNVYMVLDYAINGDFSDLKPGNILFDDRWHLILADFGTAKQIQNKSSVSTPNNDTNSRTNDISNNEQDVQNFSQAIKRGASSANDMIRANQSADQISNNMDELLSNNDIEQESKGSFVGTEDYVSPEIINNEEPSFASDLWSLGIIIYQLFTGKTPFKAMSPYYTFENILACEYSIPDSVPMRAQSLIKDLLVIDKTQRLGAGEQGEPNSMEALKSHPFFEGINFQQLHTQQAPIDSRKVIQSPMKQQLMQYMPQTKAKNLTQEFTKYESQQQPCSNTNNNARIRDFSDLVRLQKLPSQQIQPDHIVDISNLKIIKAQSTNNFDNLTSVSNKSSPHESPMQRKSIKKTGSSNDLRQHLKHPLFKSHAAPLKYGSSTTSELNFDDCMECMQMWKEKKSEMVKKKTKLIFYADRLIKFYENGYFAYYTSKSNNLKACHGPGDIISCVLERKDKLKLSTKTKSYKFKFNSSKAAKEWVILINQSLQRRTIL